MSDQPEQFTATSYFNSDSIIKRLNDVAMELTGFLSEDAVPYLIYETDKDKRQVFRNFIQHVGPGTDYIIDNILELVIEAGLLQKQKGLEAAMNRHEALLKSYVQAGSQLNTDSEDEESYW